MNRTLLVLSVLVPPAVGTSLGLLMTMVPARIAEEEAVQALTDACAEHCFPFVSSFDLAQEPSCWCADLGGTWHPDTW